MSREPPQRSISKKEGVRHLLHAAIRSTFAQEDPFAIHLLGQSAEKVLVDLAKRAGTKDDVLFSFIRPNKKEYFSKLYRESYNFLNHADRDHGGELGVYDLVTSNDLLLFSCCMRFEVLFGEMTVHMRTLVAFVAAMFPGVLDLDALPGMRAGVALLKEGCKSRGDLLQSFNEPMALHPDILTERSQDLIDLIKANDRQIDP